jgi:TrmH family RNA methyltransferase
MIVSKQNPKVKYIRRLQHSGRFRRQEGAFVVEGTHWLDEVAKCHIRPLFLLVTESWISSPGNKELADRIPATKHEVSAGVLDSVSKLETQEGVLAVLPDRPLPLPEVPTLLLVLDGVADPGNVGTILRTAAAAGVEGVILAPGCVDAYNPKVVRSSMGAHFQVAIHRLSWQQIATITAPMARWIAVTGKKITYEQVDWRQPSAIIVGSEASGAGKEACQLSDDRFSIPMGEHTESLNVAVASGIILFEAARQRRGLDDGVHLIESP